MKKIVVPLSVKGIERLQREVEEFRKWQLERANVLLERLAMMGATGASLRFSRAVYTGLNDVEVTAEKTDKGYKILASGSAVLFIEFGSGVTYGGGHPAADEYGMGPGTYPEGKGHWDDPRGWYLPKSKGGEHTFGNPPAMAMYETIKDLEAELPRLVKEVFSR